MSHAALAELFLCLVVTLAVITSTAWRQTRGGVEAPAGLAATARLATMTSVLVFAQILLGAVMRHSGAGLAIPDFPLAFGRLIPPSFDFPIAIHFSHRVGALTVAAAVLWLATRILRTAGGRRSLWIPASAMGLLVGLQVTLGALVVLTGKAVVPNTAHVATGAILLAMSVVLSLFSWRWTWLATAKAGAVAVLAQPELSGGRV